MKNYKVTFNYPNGDNYSVFESKNLNEAIEVFEKTFSEDSNHSDFKDSKDIEVELRKYESNELTAFKKNEVKNYPDGGWIIKN